MEDLRERLKSYLGEAYTFDRELGGGGMSRLFLAEETQFGRQVVIKFLAPDMAADISAERFAREIKIAAVLQHANIVPLIAAGEIDGLPYYTMPFVDGQSLRKRLTTMARLPIVECVSILRDVARALGYAHEHGVVHRDIKPDNVLLSRGAAEVTDFGIAKAIADSRSGTRRTDAITQFGTSLGTPAYMSPEQVMGNPDIDARADIYAVGCMAYEMLDGHAPFSGTPAQVMAAHINAAPAPISRTDVPAQLQHVVMKCLAKDPARRYQSADELLAEIEAVATPIGGLPSSARLSGRRVAMWMASAAAAAVLWFGSGGYRRERWVRAEAIPRIKDYVERGQADSAWLLAREVSEAAPNDTALANLWPRFAWKLVFHSKPEGAKIYRASYEDTTHWVYLGTTPTDTVLLSSRTGFIRVEKRGYRTLLALTPWNDFTLHAVGSPDSDMTTVPGGSFGVFLVGTEGIPALNLGDYLMDVHEVTNRQYKAFVDAGGYAKRDLWPDGADLSKYVDKTGRRGPSTWEAGDFPPGQAEMPVGGVSWYEAAAYAAFVHKSLPTIYHWARAAAIWQARFVMPGSNFESNGPVRGSTFRGVSQYGVFDMAGNVREWCENATTGDQRFILGGGWSDAQYGFTDAYAQPPSDRSPINGIRLVKYLTQDTSLTAAKAPQRSTYRDYTREKPVSAAEFKGFRHIFDYDRTSLKAHIESHDSTDEDYIIERVSYDAAYGNERMFADVYLPRHGTPPYQTIVFFPGSGAMYVANSVGWRAPEAFIAKAGRIFVLPVLKSTFERRDSLRNDVADSSIFWRDHVVMWTKDIRRTLDYLSTRPDVDTARFGFFARSWGSNMAPITLSIEPRFKAALLYVAGLGMERSRPEADPFNYLPRVKQPVSMLNGRYDFFFPVETAQRPFFGNLGTPAEDKIWNVYDGGHDVPWTDLVAETLKWYDKYLGPVR